MLYRAKNSFKSQRLSEIRIWRSTCNSAAPSSSKHRQYKMNSLFHAQFILQIPLRLS